MRFIHHVAEYYLWRFEEGAGGIAHDLSPHGHHGDLGEGIEENQPDWFEAPELWISAGHFYVGGLL